jgi:hypothetical protein
MPAFEAVIASPETFMTGSDYSDMYIVYENGMKEKQRDLHSQDAGISHRDRKNIFDNIVNEIADLSSEEELKAYRVKGKSELAPVMFEDNFELSSERKDGFLENIENVLKNGPVTVEVWYSSGEELIRDHLLAALNLHLKNTDISVQSYNLKDYAEKLELRNEKAKENLEGIRKRQTEVADYICSTAGRADGTTIAIVIFHEKKYYEAESVKNPKLDPKLALRCGFASTGRLTQFLTEEAYKEKSEKNLGQPDRIRQDGKPEKSNAYNMVIRNTILDVYRQLGFINSLSDKRSVLNRTMLDEKIAVGIHVVSERKLMNKIRMKACPIIVSCNLVSHEIWVDAAFLIQQKQGGNLPELCEISCTYSEFPIRFLQMLEKAGEDKRISPVPAFLEEWFQKLDPDKKYEIMVVADGTSRKVIEGISNKEIAVNYSPADENVVKLPLNGKNRTSITLSDYDNIDLIRLRTNAEVPDYYPEENIGSDAEIGNFVRSYGLYVLENIFYSRDASPRREGITHKEDSSKLSTDKSFQHRKMIEIFPLYVSNPEEKIACVWDVHNLRNISIQYEATMTELPLPLHLGKLLEEYFIAH